MKSVILQIATKYIKWLLVTFALIALLRGHNSPGGGFIGGLLVGLSVVFHSFTYYGAECVKRSLKIQPEAYIASGLLLILLSTLPGLLLKQSFMAGIWISVPMPLLGDFKIGTPFLFDIGVFMAVIGVTLLFFFTLNSIVRWK